MGQLNKPGCIGAIAGNTGVPQCAFSPAQIVGVILVPKTFVILTADIPTIVTKLQEATMLAKSNRIFPVFRFEEIADSSEEESMQTLGYGSKQPVKDGKYDWTFKMVNGLLYHNKLRLFNKATKKVLLVDANNVIYGTKVDTGLAGLSLDFFYAKPFKVGDGTNGTAFQVRLGLSKPDELNENVGFVEAGEDVEEAVKGILDVNLTKLATVAGKATVGITTDLDGINMYDSFADAFASGPLWDCSKAGVPVVITGVVKNPGLKGWDVSFVGVGDHVITLKDPATLAAANIGGAPDNGFESDSLSVTMPA